jgi:hypothetical protein
MALNIRNRAASGRKPLVRSSLLPKGVDHKKLQELLPFMTKEEKEQLDALIAPRPGEIEWMPLPGPQLYAFNCTANMLLYGGAAGGGKSDLLMGLAYYKHHRSAIFRREYTNLAELMDRASELFGYKEIAKYNGFERRWNFHDREGHLLEWGAADHVGRERRWQGRTHDLKGFDEGPQFTFPQFNYLRGWNRPRSTTPPGQLLQTIVTCNPPQTVEERWINIVWAPWLDKHKFPEGEAPGKLIWFITHEGNYVKVDGPGRHKYKFKDHLARSHTFIPSALKDNPYLDDGQYESVLQSLPEPLRSQLLFGDFQAGVSDDPQQLFPTVWIEEAMKRWSHEYGGKPPVGMAMTQLGVDVARGGRDRTVLSPRWGAFFGEQITKPGWTTKDGMKVAAEVVKVIHPKTVVVIDAIGVGASPLDWLRSQDVITVGFVASEGCKEDTDRTGYLNFRNKKAMLGWRMREALDPQYGMNIAIPPDPELQAELVQFKFELTAGGLGLNDKDEIKEVLGRSPDKAEALLYAGLPHRPFDFGEIGKSLAASGITPSQSVASVDDDWGVADDPDAPWNH